MQRLAERALWKPGRARPCPDPRCHDVPIVVRSHRGRDSPRARLHWAVTTRRRRVASRCLRASAPPRSWSLSGRCARTGRGCPRGPPPRAGTTARTSGETDTRWRIRHSPLRGLPRPGGAVSEHHAPDGAIEATADSSCETIRSAKPSCFLGQGKESSGAARTEPRRVRTARTARTARMARMARTRPAGDGPDPSGPRALAEPSSTSAASAEALFGRGGWVLLNLVSPPGARGEVALPGTGSGQRFGNHQVDGDPIRAHPRPGVFCEREPARLQQFGEDRPVRGAGLARRRSRRRWCARQ